MEEQVKTIRIECDGSTTVTLDELTDLQHYKILTDEGYHKAKASIIKLGFSFPIFMWIDPQGTKYIIDAHQRKRTLIKMRDSEGYIIPPLPAIHVFAKDKKEAKEKILAQESQYGDITEEGLYEFMNEPDAVLDPGEVEEFSAIDTFDAEYGDKEGSSQQGNNPDKRPELTNCPNCGFQLTPLDNP